MTVPGWLVVPLTGLACAASLVVLTLGLTFHQTLIDPSNGPGDDVGRGVGLVLIVALMGLFTPLALGAAIGGSVLGRGTSRWLAAAALPVTIAGVAWAVVPVALAGA